MLGPTIDALADELAGRVKVGKVNVDEQPQLSSAFKVMSIPMITLTKGDKLVMQTVGVKSKDALLIEIESKL